MAVPKRRKSIARSKRGFHKKMHDKFQKTIKQINYCEVCKKEKIASNKCLPCLMIKNGLIK